MGLYTYVSWCDPVAANPVAPRSAVIPPNMLSTSLALSVGSHDEEEEEEEEE